MTDRPIFMVKNRIYVSAGVLPYNIDKEGNVSFLVQHLMDGKWLYEDFGGKSDVGDTCIEDVAFRECVEEMNNAGPITADFLRNQLDDKRSVIYRIPDDKYMLYFIYIPSDVKDSINTDIFGDMNDDYTVRKVEWLDYKDLMDLSEDELHPRLIPSDFKNNLPLILSQAVIEPEKKYY